MWKKILVIFMLALGGEPGYTQPPVAAGPPLKPYVQAIPGSAVSFKMLPVPGGEFLMGSPEQEKGRRKDEGPRVKVKLDPFWMEEHEVTYDEYILFQDESRDTDPRPDGITRPSPPYVDFTLGMGKDGGYPANSMSQYAALMYCKWLYKKTGIFYRLPTEAEWEYACRAGTQTAYPFGDDAQPLKDYAWYAGNSDNKYHPVKQLKPNTWGFYDMLGNVAEWTLDQYDENYFQQIGSNAENPLIKPVSKSPRTVKGGSFTDEAAALRSAARLPSSPEWNKRDPQIPKSKWWNADAPFIGFRVMRPLKQPSPQEAEQFFKAVLILK
ncbi:MAG TPA: SUMF1/EgtB/PvdO family nonheme iron enzyme [Chitinophagaceae bacterium]